MAPRMVSRAEYTTPSARDDIFPREFKLFPTGDKTECSPDVEYHCKMLPGLVSTQGIFGEATNQPKNLILSGWDGPPRAAPGSPLGLGTKEVQETRGRARTPVKFGGKSPQTNSLRSVVGSVKTESVLERVMRSGSKPATVRRLPTAGRYKPRSPTNHGSSNRADYFSVEFDEETKHALKTLGDIILCSTINETNTMPVCESYGTPKEHPDVKSSRSQKFTSATSLGEPGSDTRGLFGTDFGAAISHLGQLNSKKMLPSFQTSNHSAFSKQSENESRKGRSLTESTNLYTDENRANNLEILSTQMIEKVLNSPESDGNCYGAQNAHSYEPSSEENMQHWCQQAPACQEGTCSCRKNLVATQHMCQWHEGVCSFGAKCTPEQPDSPPLSDETRQQIEQLNQMGLQMLKLRRLWGTFSTAAPRDECQVTRFRRDVFMKQLFGVAGSY